MADSKRANVDEQVYPKSLLIDNANAIFGVNPEVVIGALYGNTKTELTKTEVKDAVDKFLSNKPKGGNK
jgi:hypothetical protein